MEVSKFSVRHPVYVLMAVVVLIVFGLAAIITSNLEFMPNMSLPQIFVITIYPGASAEEVEKDVIKVMEDNFVTLPNFKSMDSSSSESYGVITIKYQDGVDVYDQIDEVRNRINEMIEDLPDSIQGTPKAVVGGASMLPIMTFTIEYGNDNDGLHDYLENTLKPNITKIDGVADFEIIGLENNQIEVKMRTEDLLAKEISPLQIYQLLQYGKKNMPLGTGEYRDKNTSIRFEADYESIDTIKNLTVGQQNGTIIRLEDVADVTMVNPEPELIAKKEGKKIVAINITKREDGNTVKINNAIKKVLEQEELNKHGSVHFNIVADDSRIVLRAIASVINTGVSAIIIAILIIFVVLADLKSTMVIALSLPLSIWFTFVGMKVMNISISLLSTAGIVIALGSIVDGSIVMLEQVNRNYMEKDGNKYKYSVNESIYNAGDNVSMSILGSALTTIVVFLPILRITGIVGQALRDLSIAFILALTGSCISAIVVIPCLLKVFLTEERKEHKKNILDDFMEVLTKAYGGSVRWVLKNRKFIIIMSIVILVVSGWAVTQLGLSFIPSADINDFYINAEFPVSYTKEMTEAKLDEIEKLVWENIPDTKTTLTVTGKIGSGVQITNSDNKGYVRIVLENKEERSTDIHTYILQMKKIVDERVPDAKVSVDNGGFDNLIAFISGGGGYGLTLTGSDMNTLYSEACRIKEYLENDPMVMNVTMDTSFDKYQAIVKTSNDYLSSIGLTAYEAGMTSAVVFNGVDTGIYTDEYGDRYNIRLKSDVTDKPFDETTLSNLKIVSQSGSVVSYDAVSDLEVKNAVSQINHTDRANTITINCSTSTTDTTKINSRFRAYMAENPLAPGITESAGGMMKLIEDTIPLFVTAMAIAVFLVYTVMVYQFERFNQPLLILVTIPFCLIGVAIGLLAFGSTINILSALGIVSLIGTAVNNGIILIDRFNLTVGIKQGEVLRKRGEIVDADNLPEGRRSLEEDTDILNDSIVESCQSRLKSILMTSLTTMFGVVPMAIGKGEGAEMYAPMGQAIAGGLLATTVISLFVMPVLYYILERSHLKRIYKEKARRING
ncbi:MAG: efflux RND transporter permease subunit [Sphaerochaetaceae bacterium]|nr:efflux RND transporter permease subunit [Sphaerochaetaceae bacterium]